MQRSALIFGDDAVIEIEVAPVLDVGQGFADEIGALLVALLVIQFERPSIMSSTMR